MLKLCLVRHGETAATRRRAFGSDEPLLPGGRAAASALGGLLPAGAAVRASPARRCRETAVAAGLHAVVDPGLDQVDIGAWRGRTFADVHAADPAAVAAWLADPHAAPHGGESLARLVARTGAWADGLADPRAGEPEALVAVTHSEVVRALVVGVLGAPARAFWQLEVEPLSVTELHRHDGRWTLRRLNRAVAA